TRFTPDGSVKTTGCCVHVIDAPDCTQVMLVLAVAFCACEVVTVATFAMTMHASAAWCISFIRWFL
ncbi:MAG TPA: hypothetical protein PKN64_17620, partial [Casimicrobium sp.]|nr:hypothetical protein [Casimicrobium sp.]